MIHKSRIKELSLFLNIEEKLLREMDKRIQDLPGFAKWINIAVNDWDLASINKKDRQQIENWFKNNDKYIFELSDVHSRPTKNKITKQTIKILKRFKMKSVLDYGGGIGEESIMAAKNGFLSTMADLPSLTFDFAKWRAQLHGVRVDFIKIKNDQPLRKKYDAVTCFEVLQHLYRPDKVSKHIIEHINPNGLFIITTRINNPGYSMVLEKNFKYEEGMINFLTKNGLTLVDQIYQYGDGARQKFLYIYQKLTKKI
jgi:2-polyprenyl-3-methyl-5-hydroxy-6-metoxy-1,4-benzoquinol methylase